MIYIKLDDLLPNPDYIDRQVYGRIRYIKNSETRFISPLNWVYGELKITRDKRKSGYDTNTYYWYIAK